jgi:hypothetical protein
MSAAPSSMPHPGSARLTLRALSIWPNEDGPARRLQIPSSADEGTNACMTWLSMRRSGFNQNPWRTQPGKRSSVSSMGRTLWPGSRKTGLTLWQESRVGPEISAEESCLHKGVEKLIGDRPPTRACRASAEREPRAHAAVVIAWNGAPRSTKIGNIASPWHYDAAARHALQPANLGLPTVLRYACK